MTPRVKRVFREASRRLVYAQLLVVKQMEMGRKEWLSNAVQDGTGAVREDIDLARPREQTDEARI